MSFDKMIIVDNNQIKGYGSKIIDHFIGLSYSSNRQRFFNYRSEEILRDWVYSLTHHKSEIEHFWVLMFKDNEIISIGQLALDKNYLGEIAISVVDKFQENGIGKITLEELINLAKRHLVKTLVMSCYADNSKMVSLVSFYGFKLSHDHSEINGELDLSLEMNENETKSDRERSA